MRRPSKAKVECRAILAKHNLLTTDVIRPAAAEHPRTLLGSIRTAAALRNAIKGWRAETAIITRDDEVLSPWRV